MKHTIYLLIFCLTSTICFSQVGIGTVNPLQELHIAGASSVIRIESLNASNNAYNDGIKLAPVFVDGKGDLVLGSGTGPNGVMPLNFLIDVPNFIPDHPHGYVGTGSVVNNADLVASTVADTIVTISVNVPQDAILEIKYGITTMVSGYNLKEGWLGYIRLNEAIAMQTYLVVDLNSDGLSEEEGSKIYGRTAQHYTTNNQGVFGYPYMSGQAYLKVPGGTHTIYFYGLVRDGGSGYTSVGFGGAQDYLKIRVYN